MIKNIVVDVESRSGQGKNPARRLRREGKVPAVLYGLGVDPFSLSVSPRRIEEILRLDSGRNTIFRLSLAGADQPRAVMIRDLQRDPVTDAVIHIDFVRVDLQKAVKVSVPVRLVGIAVGVKTEAGLLEPVTRHVEVECLPEEIPEHFDVDVTELHVNQHASVADLHVSERVKILNDPDTILVTIAPARVEEVAPTAEAAVEAGATAEPEVIKKGKEAAPETAETKEKEKK